MTTEPILTGSGRVLKRIAWFVAIIVAGIPFAVVCTLVMAVGVLIGEFRPYVRHDDGFTFGIERVDV